MKRETKTDDVVTVKELIEFTEEIGLSHKNVAISLGFKVNTLYGWLNGIRPLWYEEVYIGLVDMIAKRFDDLEKRRDELFRRLGLLVPSIPVTWIEDKIGILLKRVEDNTNGVDDEAAADILISLLEEWNGERWSRR